MTMWKFTPARWFRKGRLPTTRTVLVIHDMEVQDGADTAEKVATLASRWDKKASFHFAVDKNSVVQGVRILDTAWAAPGANNDGVQFEIAGFARHTRAEWLANKDTLTWAAAAVAEVIVYLKRVHKREVPVRRMTKAQLLDKKQSGLAGHLDINDAFHESTHTDPGSNFPWDVFLPMVKWWIAQIDKPGYQPKFI